MLAVNDKRTLPGKVKVKDLYFMRQEYAERQPFNEHIFRQGEKLYPQLRAEPNVPGTTPPQTVQIKICSTATDPSGFLLTLQRAGQDAEGYYLYRCRAGEEPKVGPASDPALHIIGVINTREPGNGLAENTTADEGNPIDSNAISWGQPRGYGRSYVDEANGILLANLEYMQAAGVEFIKIISVDDWNKKDKVPAKNQADLLYFSGHGYEGRLYGKWPPTEPMELNGASVTDLNPRANWNEDMDCFVIAGCSVLNIESITGESGSWGLDWANQTLLGRWPGGPLDALCGYYMSAPGDTTSAHITQKVARDFSNSRKGWVDAWMEANSEANIGVGVGACAMDGTTYKWNHRRTLAPWSWVIDSRAPYP